MLLLNKYICPNFLSSGSQWVKFDPPREVVSNKFPTPNKNAQDTLHIYTYIHKSERKWCRKQFVAPCSMHKLKLAYKLTQDLTSRITLVVYCILEHAHKPASIKRWSAQAIATSPSIKNHLLSSESKHPRYSHFPPFSKSKFMMCRERG